MMGGIIGAVIGVIIGVMLVRLINRQPKQHRKQSVVQTPEPFAVSEYLARIERVALDIELEKRKKAPTVIVLWLLREGLRINPNGSYEWIKRENNLSLAEKGGAGGSGKFVTLYSYAFDKVSSIDEKKEQICIALDAIASENPGKKYLCERIKSCINV